MAETESRPLSMSEKNLLIRLSKDPSHKWFIPAGMVAAYRTLIGREYVKELSDSNTLGQISAKGLRIVTKIKLSPEKEAH